MLVHRKISCWQRQRRCLRKWLLISLTALLLSNFLVTQAEAALFYTGGVSIDSLLATIDVTNKAEIGVEYTLVNHGPDEEIINLTFSPSEATARIDGNELSNPVTFSPRETKKLSLSYSLSLPSAEAQGIRFAPMLFFNEMASSEKVGSYEVKLILPEGVKRITYSSMACDDTAFQNGRLVVMWQKKDLYPGSLAVSWTTLDVDIAAVKRATPSRLTAPGEIVEVEVTIQNKGDSEIRNIALSDSFFPGAFEAIQPLAEFELVQPEMSDPHLYWKKEINSLKPGETKTYTYSVKVKALGPETKLDALVVLVNGIPVSVSNDVILHSELEERYKPKAPEREFLTTYVIISAVVVAAIVALVFFIRSRKKA